MSNSLQPCGLLPTGLLCPWDLQTGILEWVAMPSSRGSSPPRDQTCVSDVSCIGRQVLYHQGYNFISYLLPCNTVTTSRPLPISSLKQQTFVISQEPKHNLTGHLWFKVSLGVIVHLLARAVVISRLHASWRSRFRAHSGAHWQASRDRFHVHSHDSGMLWFLFIYFVHPLELESALHRGPESK